MPATPISSNKLSPGAWVRRARTQATCGRPIPTTAISPSRTSFDAAVTIISLAVTSESCCSRTSVEVDGIDMSPLIAENRLGLNLIHAVQAADFLQVLPVIARTKHIFLQILIHF